MMEFPGLAPLAPSRAFVGTEASLDWQIWWAPNPLHRDIDSLLEEDGIPALAVPQQRLVGEKPVAAPRLQVAGLERPELRSPNFHIAFHIMK
jgi:hypothetical protein